MLLPSRSLAAVLRQQGLLTGQNRHEAFHGELLGVFGARAFAGSAARRCAARGLAEPARRIAFAAPAATRRGAGHA